MRAPQLPLELIARRVQDAYGLAGEWRRLGGEREQNFRLITPDDTALVVKVASLDEPLESLAFQAEALEHIARVDPELSVPRLRRTLGGEASCHIADEAGREHALRLLSFLPGNNLFSQLR